MKDTLTKTLGGIILVAGSVAGTYTLTESNATDIQTQLDAKTEEAVYYKDVAEQQQIGKVLVAKDYIVSQISSGRVPTFTGAVSSEEYQVALIEAYYASGGKSDTVPKELNVEVEKLLLDQGKILKCN